MTTSQQQRKRVEHSNNSGDMPQEQSLKPPKISLTSQIREGLRKISGCKDVPEEEIQIPKSPNPKRKTPVIHSPRIEALLAIENKAPAGETKDKDKRKRWSRTSQSDGRKTSFEVFLDGVPRLDPIDRTVGWVFKQTNATQDRRESLGSLPMRGTILPTRYDPTDEPLPSDSVQTSVSGYESARGTHGRGTPPPLDPHRPRLDDFFYEIQRQQERQARQKLIAMGQQHLLSFNLMDVYSHQVPGYPAGTTPDIVPFISRDSQFYHRQIPLVPTTGLVHKLLQTEPLQLQYTCQWIDCRKRFLTTKELISHVEQAHVSAYSTGSRRLACHWDNCQKIFVARYKLLIHIRNAHCKEYVLKPNVRKKHNLSNRSFSTITMLYFYLTRYWQQKS